MRAACLSTRFIAFVFATLSIFTSAFAAPTAVYLDAAGGVSLTEFGAPPREPPPALPGGQ